MLPVLLLILAGAWLVGRSAMDAALSPLLTREVEHAEAARVRLEANLKLPLAHLQSLVEENAVRSVYQAQGSVPTDPMAEAFMTLLSRNPVYSQVRWIGPDDQERVKVERDARGRPRPSTDLQHVGARYYAEATRNLPAAMTYVSAMDLMFSSGRVVVPYRPTLRMARRLYGAAGEPRGLLVLSMDAQTYLGEMVQSAGAASGRVHLLDAAGHWLRNPDHRNEWTFTFGQPPGFARESPEAWSRIVAQSSGQAELADGVWTWNTVKPAEAFSGQVMSPSSWKVVSQLPPDVLTGVALRVWLPVGALALVLCGVFGLGARKLVALEAQRRVADDYASAERRIHQAQHNFETVFEANANGLVVVDAQGRITMVNRELSRMFGYAREELVGQPLSLLLPEGVRSTHGQLMVQYFSEPFMRKMGADRALQGCARGGRLFPIEVGLSHFTVDGQARALANVVDITARRQVESERSDLLKIIADTPAFIGMADLQGRLLYHNKAAYRMLGRPEGSDLSMLSIRDIHPAWAGNLVLQEGIPAAIQRGFWEGESALLGAGGREIPVLQVILAHRDEQGQPQRVSTIMQDITEARRAREMERYRSSTLQMIVEGAPLDMILSATVRGVELIDAGARCSLLLVSEDGRTLGHAVAPSLPEEYKAAIDGLVIGPGQGCCGSAAHSGERVVAEDIRTASSWVAFRDYADRAGLRSCWSEPVKDSRQKVLGTLAVYHEVPRAPTEADISLAVLAASVASIAIERRNTEMVLERHRDHLEDLVEERSREIRALNQQLEQRAREAEDANRAKSTFLANMSHEIRTPLNAIIGLSHMIRRTATDPQLADRSDKVIASGQHLLGIINAILDLSKIDAGKFTFEEHPLFVESVVDNVVSMLQSRADEKKLQLRTDMEVMPRNLLGDATRLQQALLNYAANAIKFTSDGHVILRVRLEEDAPDSALVRFEVSDTGIGVSKEAMGRLFGVFEQADNSTTRRFGGTGLGLAITRNIAQLLGGDAGARSEPDVGSTFWFTARLRKAAAPHAQRSRSEPGAAERTLRRDHFGLRVLVAEDAPINREITTVMLEDVGFVVDVAEDGVEAVKLAGAQDYRLILMDMQMPNMDGLDATRAIRQLPGHARTPIIAMTANAFNEDRQLCMEAGMTGFVSKPVPPPELYAALLAALEAETAPGSGTAS